MVSSLLKSMQELPITAITQKEGGTQLKLIIDFEVLYTARAGPATIFLASRQRLRHNVIELQLQAKIRKIVKASVSTWSSQDEYTVDLLQ